MFSSNTSLVIGLLCLLTCMLGAACGVKGPPLPPLALTPQASDSTRINSQPQDEKQDFTQDELEESDESTPKKSK